MVPKVDSGWLKLFEQKGWVYFSLAFFFGALRYLLQNEFLPGLAGLRWLSDSSLLGAILFAILAIGAIGHRIGGLAIEYVGGWRARKATLTRLNSLSDVEHRILSYLINANCQSFDYRNDDGDVQQLVAKGLLFTPPGQYNFHMVPFIVPDFVWRELRRRREDFSSAAPPDEPPWVKDWMAY
jgi:hypothetical protein